MPPTPRTPRTPTTPRREPPIPLQPILPWTQVHVPELPAEWGPFYEAGQGNPYSPLRNHPRPQIPQGSPPINEEEIGTKFPTLSNGPGIERRVFVDPGYERPQPMTTPELDRASSHSMAQESDRPSYRSLTPKSNRGSYRSPTPEQLNSPEQLTPSCANRRRENVFARSPGFIFPYLSTEADPTDAEDSTVGSILQKYGDETMGANHGSPDNGHVEIDPRLSNWAWSPPNSIYTPSVNNAEQTVQNPNFVAHFAPPTAPPSGPLPDLPVNHGQDVLDAGPSQASLPSISSAESALERLLAEDRVPSASITLPHEGSFSVSSFAINESEQNNLDDPGPGSLQSSSSVSAARPGIVRSGTPPLLFGSRAIGTGLSLYEQENDLEDDDQDWETDAGSNARSRRKLEDIEATAGTGSSIADVSDSSNVSALRSAATGQVLVHPAHPRYQHSWTMLQDAQSGNLVLTPEYNGTGVFPSRNHRYQHPARLSPGHDNPFSTSPPLIRPSPRAAYNLGETAPPIPLRNPRRLRPQNVAEDITARNVMYIDDGEWVSTVDESTSHNGEDAVPARRQGSFAKIAVVGGRGNVTGTPEGTGAREVGSSLADASSPVNEVESPASKQAILQHRRTVDGSLNSAEANAPGNFYERIQNHPIFQKDSDDEDFERDFRSTPAEDLSPEIRQHRQHLVEHSLLPSPPTPPFTEPKRVSVPDHLLTSPTPPIMPAEASNTHAGPSSESRPSHAPKTQNHRAQSAPPQQAEPEPATTPPRPETARPYVGPYDDFIQANRGPPEPRGRQQHPVAADRPVARVESPHLHRLPRQAGPALQQRQKELGRVVFAVMLAFAPSLLLYGYGVMDRLMAYLCYGDVVAFPETEKKVARVVGWIGACGVLAWIIYAISQAK